MTSSPRSARTRGTARLVHYGLGADDPTEIIKRACPYWIFVVPPSFVTSIVRFVSVTLYHVVRYIGYYPWSALGWTLGFKPRHWRGLTQPVAEGKQKMFLRDTENYYKPAVWHWYVPILMYVVLTMVLITIYVLDIGHRQADVVTALPAYIIALIAYAALLVVIALGNAWKYGGWPVVHKTYCAVCPELKVVESAPSRSQAELAK